jgi:hypothetical protein
VIAYCRSKFEQQVPFDNEFRLDDAAFYCVELTEKAFRSQGLVLSEPVAIGNWEHLNGYPLTALATPYVSRLLLKHPISLDQPVFLPGNDRQGVWASPRLETVVAPEPKYLQDTAPASDGRLSLRGDVELAVFAAGELRQARAEQDDRPTETSPIAIDDRLTRHVR